MLVLALSLPAGALAQDKDGNDALIRAELRAYRHAQDFGQAARHFQRAKALLRRQTSAPVRLALDAVRCLEGSYENEDPDGQWRRLAESGMAAAQAAGAWSTQGQFTICAGNVRMAKSEFENARRWYQKALALARANGDRSLEADALNLLGTLASTRGEFREGLLDLIRARDLFIAQNQPVDALSVTNDLAVLYSRLGDHRQALVYYQAVATNLGPDAGPADRSALLGNMAASNEALGRHQQALTQVRQAKTLAEQSGDSLQLAMIQRLAGRILVSAEQPAAALAELVPAQRILSAQGDSERAAQADLYAAMALVQLRRPAEALPRAQSARAQFEQNQSLGNLNLAQTVEAKLLAAQGRFSEAYVMMDAAQQSGKQLSAQAHDYRLVTAQVALEVREQRAENQRLGNEVRAQQSVIAARDRTDRWQRVALASGALVLLGITAWAWRQFHHARRMRYLSLTDELTGLPNRRNVFAFGAYQLDHARRVDDKLTLVALDIDHFKQINDRFGHDGGDTVLREVARCLSAGLREGSRVGRAGGEEFLVVLPHTNAEQGVLAAERLRRLVAESSLARGGEPIHVTASFGVVTSPPAIGDLDALCALADKAMYAAKRGGRNCVRHYADLAPESR
jgi:diguanylate cyclase (GGDEF)-like protein